MKKPGRPPISKSIRAMVLIDYRNGMKRADIIRKYRISASSLYGWLQGKIPKENR